MVLFFAIDLTSAARGMPIGFVTTERRNAGRGLAAPQKVIYSVISTGSAPEPPAAAILSTA
jgi:hypothetical protein